MVHANADEESLDRALGCYAWCNEDNGIWVVGHQPGKPLSEWPSNLPFMLVAAKFGRATVVRKPVGYYGCSLENRTKKKKQTALHLAAWHGHAHVVKLLLGTRSRQE